MNPLDVKCPICNAKPGERCAGVVDAKKTLDVPHAGRVTAAITARVAELEREQVRILAAKDEACDIADRWIPKTVVDGDPFRIAEIRRVGKET